MTKSQYLHLFQGYGVELEYMIVDKHNLSIKPISDQLIQAVAGEITSEVSLGEIAWSNELVMHVIELKTNGPSATLTELPEHFLANVKKINEILSKYDAKLLPSGAHPFMHPDTETHLWPHDNNEIYTAYNEIFGCGGHGWSNLQSTHLNLPFADENEFTQLHAAIRLLLPIIPALTASTPILDGKLTGLLDTRLEYYRTNQKAIPAITGNVIPEIVTSFLEYESNILGPMYAAIAPHDFRNILQEEWLNSRGAIARFDRYAIEIRVIDIQESVQADLAILAFIVTVLQAQVNEQWVDFETQLHFPQESLVEIFNQTIRHGLATVINDANYLRLFGYQEKSHCSVKELWQHILQTNFIYQSPMATTFHAPLEVILAHGSLAERIIKALHGDYSRANIISTYQLLTDCLSHDTIFTPT